MQDQFWKENISKFEEKDFQVFLQCNRSLDQRCQPWHGFTGASIRQGLARRACNLTLLDVLTPLQVLRVLLKLLETSRDAKTLAVGCHDLGAFITHYPAGKGLVTGARTPCSWAECHQQHHKARFCDPDMITLLLT